MSLLSNQEKAIDKLGRLRAGALFMKMGTGKTRVAIELIKSKLAYIDIVIWIAPASLIKESSYQDEIKKWGDDIYHLFHFYSIESIGSSSDKFNSLLSLAMDKKSFCVVDESITIKNSSAKRTKALVDNYSLFDFRLILNGTPLSKGLIDLYSQIQFLSPKILNMSEEQFADCFLVYCKDGSQSWRRWSKPANEAALIEIIRPYIFDCELEIDVKIVHKDFRVCLNCKESDGYEKLKEEAEAMDEEEKFLPLAQRFQAYYTINTEKYQELKKLLREITERKEKVIIYVKYLDEIEHIKNLIPTIAVYSGADKSGIKEIKKDKDVLVSTYGTGSLGHNLQMINNIIYLSQTFNYKDKIQSLHRVYRTGQTRQVNIYNFWVNTGLEGIISLSLSKKTSVEKNIKELIAQKGIKGL